MVRPPPEIVQMWASLSRSHPHLSDWLEEWRQRELDQLPYVAGANVMLAQGRCQVLTEIHKLVHDAPELSAEFRRK